MMKLTFIVVSFSNLFQSNLNSTKGFLFSSTMMSSLGLSISVGNLSGNVLLNFAYMGLADLSAKTFRFIFLHLFPNRRRLLTTCAYGFLGVSCLTLGILTRYTPEQSEAMTTLFIIGKFSSSITMSSVFMLMAESFPAECRALG